MEEKASRDPCAVAVRWNVAVRSGVGGRKLPVGEWWVYQRA